MAAAREHTSTAASAALAISTQRPSPARRRWCHLATLGLLMVPSPTLRRRTMATLQSASSTGPGQFNWDISIVKNTQITERVRMQFRSDFYNAFNHPQFAPPQGWRTLAQSDSRTLGTLQASPTGNFITATERESEADSVRRALLLLNRSPRRKCRGLKRDCRWCRAGSEPRLTRSRQRMHHP